MTIRLATLDDVPRLVELGRAQLTASYGDLLGDNDGQLAATAAHLVTGPSAVVFVAEQAGVVVGMVGLVRHTHFLSGRVTAGEVMWYVDPSARGLGLALLRRAERWAAETGAAVIHMVAPAGEDGARVGRLYSRRGYQALETCYQAPVTPAMSAITVVDDVFPDFPAYAQAARAQPVGTVEPSPGAVFHGIAAAPDDTLVRWIATRWPTLTPTLTFVRHSPVGQVEPNYIHTDQDMGEWTAIAYLTEQPAAGDGTMFWRWRETGAIQSLLPRTPTPTEALLAEWLAWRDPAQWEAWHMVPAQPNRVVLFPAPYFHSRAIWQNYGEGAGARVIQVVFGTGGV